MTATLTPEEQLREIELDFQKYLDGDTQVAIGATYDKPLVERIRVVLQNTYPRKPTVPRFKR